MDIIPKCVIQLLTNCPNESAATRKELLIATRHILATDFRTAFIPHIDPLLDEKVWIGSGRTSYESLRYFFEIFYSIFLFLLSCISVGTILLLSSNNFSCLDHLHTAH